MQSHSRSLELRCNPHLDTPGAGEGLAQSHYIVKGKSSLEHSVIMIQMVPPKVVQCTQHTPLEGMKIHRADNYTKLMS